MKFRLPVAHRLPLSSLLQKGRQYAITSFGKNSRYISSIVELLEHDRVHDDAKETEKRAALQLALSRISSEFDRESTLSSNQCFRTRRVPVIPTGSLKLDAALEIGGLPKGRFVEIYGQEASGKTTLALHIIKQAQNAGGFCAYFDVENALDPSFAEAMGVDTENLLFSRSNSAENLLSAVDTLTKSGSVDVIVVDSVAALVPQCELDVPVGGVLRDVQSRIMTQALRKIQYSLHNSQTLIVLVNQVRSSSKSRQGIEDMCEDTCGGNALKFYSAVRLRLGKTEFLKNEDEVTGLGITVQIVKNKLAPATKKAKLGLRFGRGFCCESEVLELACEHGIIVKEGNGYLIEGEFCVNEHAAELYLAKNEVVLDKMVSMIRRMLFSKEEIVGRYTHSSIHDLRSLKKPSFSPQPANVQDRGGQHNRQSVAIANRLSEEASNVQRCIHDEVTPKEHKQGSVDLQHRRPDCATDYPDEPQAANKQSGNASLEVSELGFWPEKNLLSDKKIPFIHTNQLQRKEDERSSKNKKLTETKQKKTKGEKKLQGQKPVYAKYIPQVWPEQNRYRYFAICGAYYSLLLGFFILIMRRRE